MLFKNNSSVIISKSNYHPISVVFFKKINILTKLQTLANISDFTPILITQTVLQAKVLNQTKPFV
jgi:hypothetical protein